MATRETIVRRLRRFEFTYRDFTTAREKWEKLKMQLRYGGHGKYRGRFHVSGFWKRGQWVSFNAFSPEKLISKMESLYLEFLEKFGDRK